MASVIVNAAKGIEDFLKDKYVDEYSTYEVVRTYFPQYELAKGDTLKILVIPMKRDIERENRQTFSQDIRIDVAVTQKLTAGDELDEIDSALELVDEIVDDLAGYDFVTDDTRFVVTGAANAPIVADEHYKSFGQCTSLISLTITCFT